MGAVYADVEHTVVRLDDGRSVPVDPRNRDYAALIASGVTIGEYEAPSAVPQEVSRAQAKIALLRAGLLPSVEAAVAAAGGEVAIWYADALNWRRDNLNVNSLGAGLGLSSNDIDALFIQAAQLEA